MNIDAQSIGMLVGIATLGGLVWKMSATSTQFTESVRTLKEEIKELKSIREKVELLPAILLRIETLEKFTSSFPRAFREQLDREERASTRKSQGEFG